MLSCSPQAQAPGYRLHQHAAPPAAPLGLMPRGAWRWLPGSCHPPLCLGVCGSCGHRHICRAWPGVQCINNPPFDLHFASLHFYFATYPSPHHTLRTQSALHPTTVPGSLPVCASLGLRFPPRAPPLASLLPLATTPDFPACHLSDGLLLASVRRACSVTQPALKPSSCPTALMCCLSPAFPGTCPFECSLTACCTA